MGTKKIDLAKMADILAAGKSLKDTAEFFHVSEVAIWKARKKLSTAVVKNVALESAHKIVQNDLDIMTQMRAASTVINEQLEEAKKDILNAIGAEKRSTQQIIIKLAAEVRKQVETILHIAEAWDDHKQIAEVQAEFFAFLEELSPGARKRILDGLKRKLMLRGLLPIK